MRPGYQLDLPLDFNPAPALAGAGVVPAPRASALGAGRTGRVDVLGYWAVGDVPALDAGSFSRRKDAGHNL